MPTQIDYSLDAACAVPSLYSGDFVIDPQEIFPGLFLLIGCLAYILWPQRRQPAPVEKTRLDYLLERKEVVYANLRDLNFEYRAGKYPEEDYVAQRASLETEAATIVSEMESLASLTPVA